ncbi:MAG TPA: GtrA family protein [Bacilli bacterium]|nr:GtrA family protein [Bacilli bacterium]
MIKNFYKEIEKIYIKNKEIINYIIVGGLTTLVSIVTYFLFRLVINIMIINVFLSWVCAVSFAYITNRRFVFESKNKKVIKEFALFINCRLLTLLMEIVFMFLMVDLIKFDDRISKILVQVLILISNYVLSKLLVFRNK